MRAGGMKTCGLYWCGRSWRWDGLCEPHAYLFDWWGCEHGGYNVYQESGRAAGRRSFTEWLKKLGQAGLIEVLAVMSTSPPHKDADVHRAMKRQELKYGRLVPMEKP